MTASAAPLPKKLGRFEVGAKIGGGGMASVFVGHCTRDDGSEELVALKVIREELATDEQFSTMFVDEAKILSRLSHPNVIHTLEYGVTGPHRFIAMELLSGRTFADVWDLLVSKGRHVPVQLGAWICARVAEGLHSAHELVDEDGHALAVIHRDVNPTNIFLTHTGGVKLIDFGLARARVRMSKSVDGIVKGKIPYLAPEQVEGKDIDRRVDVYALGATLWEMATMKRLFKRSNDVATLRAIREAFVPDVRDLVKGFPEPLWRIIEKALARDRDQRYATAADVMKDLDAFAGAENAAYEEELSALLGELFPGQEAKQAQWMRSASSVRMPMHTMPPPAPVPTASSTLLEEGESVVPSTRALPEAEAEPEAKSPAEPEPTKPGAEPAKPARPRRARRVADTDVADRIAAQADDAGGGKRMWLSLAVAAALAASALWYFTNQ